MNKYLKKKDGFPSQEKNQSMNKVSYIYKKHTSKFNNFEQKMLNNLFVPKTFKKKKVFFPRLFKLFKIKFFI